MAIYCAEVFWERKDEDFTNGRYSRRHLLRFDSGIEVPGSSSPHVVALPWSDATAVDPEEMFVASLSSCHMLWFLSLAAKRGFCVESYTDAASGIMEPDQDGALAMTVVTLRPAVVFSGTRLPSPEQELELHHEAHKACFIANSVKTEVRCEPQKAVL